tara:strand:- start:721 stop:966 length:246 start_codon:yes stop_codon:yes gene_type:complete
MKEFNRMYIEIDQIQGHYVVLHNVDYGNGATDQKSIAHGPDELIDLLSALVVENSSMPEDIVTVDTQHNNAIFAKYLKKND